MADRIQAVSFDAGGTLLHPWPSVGHVYAEVAAQQGAGHFPVDTLNRQFAAAWARRGTGFRHTRAQWAALVDCTFAGLVGAPPSRTFFPAVYRRFADPDVWRIYDDVLPTLAALAERGLGLAVISNWDERLRPLLVALNLARHFRVIVVSGEVGCEKPSPVIFAAAARELGVPMSAVMHVGDSLEDDYQGALAAGLPARWLCRGGTSRRDESDRSRAISDLGELVLSL
jgi:putative hydrolase of the HAD superfamily